MSINYLPLHPAQKEVFLDQMMNPDSPHYNVGGYVRLRGRLNRDIIRKAIYSSGEVFDVFKMRFNFSGPDPLCYFQDSYHVSSLREMDFSGRDEGPETAALTWMQQHFNLPFRIDSGH